MAHITSTSLGRNALILAAASAGSYLFGLLRDRLLANTFGASRDVDIFNSAFLLPDLIMNLFAAAITTAFIPVFAKARDQYKASNDILTVIIVCVLGMASVAYLIMPWAASLIAPGFNPDELVQLTYSSRILLLSPLLFGISILLGAVLQGKHHFLAYAISPMLYNLGICFGIVFLTPITGVIIGAALHLSIRLIAVLRLRYKPWLAQSAWHSPDVRHTLRLIGPRIIGLLAIQASLWTFNAIGSTLAEGSVAIFNWARNFQSLPVSFIGITIATVLFPVLADHFAAAQPSKLYDQAKRALLIIIGLSVPAMMVMIGISQPLIGLLLGGKSFTTTAIHNTAITLIVMSLAIPLESIQHILARLYYAQHNTKYPALITVIGTGVNLVVCWWAAQQFGVFGLAVGFVMMTGVIDGLLFWPLRYHLMKKITVRIALILFLICLSLALGLGWWKRTTIKDWLTPKVDVPEAVAYEAVESQRTRLAEDGESRRAQNDTENAEDVRAIYDPLRSRESEARLPQQSDKIIIPEEYNLAIPFTSQAPFTNWDAVHEETCEEASILMAGRFLQGRGIADATDAENAMLDIVVVEENNFGYGVSLTAEQTAEVLEYIYPDLTAEVVYDFTWDEVKQAIVQGYPIIAPAAGRELGNPNFTAPGPLYHMLVIKGYTPDYVITNDPGTRKGADYTYNYDTLYNAIHDWNDGVVTSGQPVIIIVKIK